MNTATSQGLLPAWNDSVHDAQSAFRSLLTALAEPGHIQQLTTRFETPGPLHLATAAACLVLMDFETPVWLAPVFDTDTLKSYLRFHCGLPLVADPAQAHFAVLDTAPEHLGLTRYAQGSTSYPDKSATLLIQVSDLENGPARYLTGPGIQSHANFRVSGLPDDFVSRWNQNHASFPQGVDILFCSGNAVLGLPRTSRIHDGDMPCTSQ